MRAFLRSRRAYVSVIPNRSPGFRQRFGMTVLEEVAECIPTPLWQDGRLGPYFCKSLYTCEQKRRFLTGKSERFGMTDP